MLQCPVEGDFTRLAVLLCDLLCYTRKSIHRSAIEIEQCAKDLHCGSQNIVEIPQKSRLDMSTENIKTILHMSFVLQIPVVPFLFALYECLYCCYGFLPYLRIALDIDDTLQLLLQISISKIHPEGKLIL